MAGNFSIPFAGANIVLAGVYTDTNVDAFLSGVTGVTRAIGIVGSGLGGSLDGLTRITKQSAIPQALRGGDIANMANLAFRAGIQDVYVARVNSGAIASTLNWGDMTLEHLNAGAFGDQTQLKRSASLTRPDSVDIEIIDNASGVVETYEALGAMLDITYTGGGTPTATIATVAGVTTITLAADAGETVTLPSSSITNIKRAHDVINASAAWTSTLVGDSSAPLTILDGTTATFVANAATLNAGVAAQVRAINASSSIVEATAAAGASSSTGGYDFMTGGDDATAAITAADFTAALARLESVEVAAIAVGSGDAAVIASARSHAYQMSSVKNRRERSIYVGADLAASKAAFITATEAIATASGGERVIIMGNQITDADVLTGETSSMPAYYLAAYAAAYKIARLPEEGLLNKQISVNSLDYAFEDSELESFINKGILPINYDTILGFNAFTDSTTSYIADANFALRNISAMDSLDFLSKLIRINMAPLIGKTGDNTLVNLIRSNIKKTLQSQTRGSSGVLVADPATGLGYKDLFVEFDGSQIARISYSGYLAGILKYAFVEQTFEPLTLTA